MKEKDIITGYDEEAPSESDKPPSKFPRPARPWRVAVIANVKGETSLPFDAPADAGAEFDRKETIQAIQAAIESDGHKTTFLPADATLPSRLNAYHPDICFNIAEGIVGDSRESHIPALLELLRIPYTASRVLTHAIALDKTMTKRVWREMGLPTANYQEFQAADDPLCANMRFPLFVKPAREGTGMGMDAGSIVFDENELRCRVSWVVSQYDQPALVEEYLPGREFTVGVMGHKDARKFSHRPDLYHADGFHRFPLLEVESSCSVTPGVYGHAAKSLNFGENGMPAIVCPAEVKAELWNQLQSLAIAAHNAVGAVDISRVDIRLDAEGQPRLLEINTLPGLTPEFSDLCVIAKAEGLTYRDIILEILYLGAARWNLFYTRDYARKPIHATAMASIGMQGG
jgi:D-alanine-D-alanine ligase